MAKKISRASPAISINRSIIAWALTLFGLTGLAVLTLILTGVNPNDDFSPVIILIAYAPSLAAILVAWLLPGAGGLGALFKQMLVWRVNIKWYALALLGPLALVLVAIAIHMLLGGAAPSGSWLVLPAFGSIGAMMGPLIAGSLGEELGWRGFGQRLLQKKYSVFWASVVIGILWATWHMWPVLMADDMHPIDDLYLFRGYSRLIATAIIYGWIFSRTKSLLLVMLAHAGHNIAINMMPEGLLATANMPLIIALLYVAAAVALMVIKSRQLFSRS